MDKLTLGVVILQRELFFSIFAALCRGSSAG